MTETFEWPTKSRELHNHHFDSSIWNHFRFRDDDIVMFDWMKRNATKSVPMGGAFWDAGARVVINKGVNGRWTDTLTRDDVNEYESVATAKLGAACANWLATGQGLD